MLLRTSPFLLSSPAQVDLALFFRFFFAFIMYAPIGFFMEDSCFIVTYILYKTALIFAVLRWGFSCILRFRNRNLFSPSLEHPPVPISSCSSSSHIASHTITDSLRLTTFDDIQDRLIERCDTCAVCLSQLKQEDEVRELRNCCHIFHKQCIERWVDHDDDDNHKTCPLCRTPLLTSSQILCWEKSEPSWAVERLLYLFGDDLLT